jgi:hypothetical protein
MQEDGRHAPARHARGRATSQVDIAVHPTQRRPSLGSDNSNTSDETLKQHDANLGFAERKQVLGTSLKNLEFRCSH